MGMEFAPFLSVVPLVSHHKHHLSLLRSPLVGARHFQVVDQAVRQVDIPLVPVRLHITVVGDAVGTTEKSGFLIVVTYVQPSFVTFVTECEQTVATAFHSRSIL